MLDSMAFKVFVFTLMVVISVVVSTGLLMLMGVVRLEDLVVLLPEDSFVRDALPDDLKFRAEQIENTSRMQQGPSTTTPPGL